MSAEPPASPEAKLARILAWLHEKFTRNFSVGKDLWELPKARSKGLFFGQFRSRTAILLANQAAMEGDNTRADAPPDVVKLHSRIGFQSIIPRRNDRPQTLKRPATGGFL
ncbi:hypothetical protein [Rhizobium rhizogenes]|uniref:hypothetical protein n=1 Tax=Rhizobium rhizogenes TaxID=359 RepID=UPI001156D37B|nr:hypothetical protein [Rhizobium rhizogenes]NTI79174.1 hypothetical protein [Rhizobium rhizogenes]NTJ21275.1 hypothetical protein [Rhizobium rhizogenes]QUE80038.1 hypothetical protein EML492_18940 [Rhizobium rhizogenes]TQO78133.1 hypothetical protein FFE80_16745 [Rhizobium rhizogenes]TRB51134.1 hypothetical protein EXN69_28925 [Rhizobium rhizogenes]